jgi:signal transduction histidine kinase
MKRTLPPGSRLILPKNSEAMRSLRHDLRTPVNPVIGYCELIVEEAEGAAPAKFLAGMSRLHRSGRQMLWLTNNLFANDPVLLNQLTCHEARRIFRASVSEVTTCCADLRQQALAANLKAAAVDLERIGLAAGRWGKRIEEMLLAQSR